MKWKEEWNQLTRKKEFIDNELKKRKNEEKKLRKKGQKKEKNRESWRDKKWLKKKQR